MIDTSRNAATISDEDTRAYISDMAEQLARLAASIGDDYTARILTTVAGLCADMRPAARPAEQSFNCQPL